MFLPNTTCDFYKRLPTTDNFGKHTYAAKQTVKCSVISIVAETQRSPVRADTSGSRGQAEQIQGQSKFLFPRTSIIAVNDVIFKDGHWLEAIEVQSMHDLIGKVDHLMVVLRKREAVSGA